MLGTFKLMFTKEMMSINLLCFWSGCSISYWSTMLTPIMSLQVGEDKSDNEKLQLALFGMVAFGFGEVVGGFIHGLIIDWIGSRASIKVNLLVMVVTFSSTLWSLNKMNFDIYTFAMCFMWGYEDGTVNIFLF
jgi:predicted MFS family arabinose efflux permease